MKSFPTHTRPSKLKASDMYETPDEVLNAVRKRLGIGFFNLDVCATPETSASANHYGPRALVRSFLVDRYWRDIEINFMDGLHAPWHQHVRPREWAWCNPPYSGNQIPLWLRKVVDENRIHGVQVAVLLPHARSTDWWHRLIRPYASEVHTFKRRISFLLDGQLKRGNAAESMLVVYRAGEKPGSVIDFPKPVEV